MTTSENVLSSQSSMLGVGNDLSVAEGSEECLKSREAFATFFVTPASRCDDRPK
jgi:hypothetical protein